MQEEYNNNYPNDFNDEINLRELFYIILGGKWIIVSVTAFLSIIGVIYSLSLPNIYVSKALLAPVNASVGINAAVGGYTNLAGLAGINLPNSADSSGNSVKALRKISSLSFFEKDILSNIYLPDLMALKSWNRKTNTQSYNEKIYDSNTNTWIGEYSQRPSAQKSFIIFKTHLSLSEDKLTGFVTLSIKHKSPFVAKQWADLVVNEINNFYRQKDKSEAEKAVSYLNQQISMTGLSEIKEVLAELLQEQTEKLTLIEANESYVFEFIDPPAVMEKKSEPKRALICIVFAFLGGMLGVSSVLIRHFFYSEKS